MNDDKSKEETTLYQISTPSQPYFYEISEKMRFGFGIEIILKFFG